MLVFPDFWEGQMKYGANLSECFFGTRPIGETWKLEKGGSEKEPATQPRAIPVARFWVTISG